MATLLTVIIIPAKSVIVSSIYLKYLKIVFVTDKLLHTLSGHSESVKRVIFLENGNLASASEDKSIKLWDPSTGSMLAELTGHFSSVLCLAQLHNGWLASGTSGHTINIWDIGEKKVVKTLYGHTKAIFSLKVLPNGHLASCSFDNSIFIWNPYLTTGSLSLMMPGHNIVNHAIELGLLTNGHLVTCSDEDDQDNTIRIWDPKTGSIVKSIETKARSARSLLVLSSGQLAVGFQDGTIRFFEPDECQSSQPASLNHGYSVVALGQLENGYLVSAGQVFSLSSIKIWNLDKHSLVQQISTGLDEIFSLSISFAKKLICIGSTGSSIQVLSLKYD